MNLKDRWKSDKLENSAPCALCKKHLKFTAMCKAYPERIPDEILEAKRKCEYFEKRSN